jgi:AraC-like DNA-binding protein
MLAIRDSGVLNECDVGSEALTEVRTYREYLPPPAFTGIVECFWRRDPWQPPACDLGVMPDGRVDLVWGSNGEVRVMGPQQRALGRPFAPDVTVVGVRFAPGVGPSLLGVPGHELADLHPSVAALGSRAAKGLMRDIATIEDPADAPLAIARAIQRRIDTSWAPDLVITRASALLARPGARVERVAIELGLSRRHLERRFREFVGYAPKTLQRILRFQSLLHALSSDHAGGLARVAPALGYSDQPHLTRETREISGLSPMQLEATLRAIAHSGATGIFKTGTARASRAERLHASAFEQRA